MDNNEKKNPKFSEKTSHLSLLSSSRSLISPPSSVPRSSTSPCCDRYPFLPNLEGIVGHALSSSVLGSQCFFLALSQQAFCVLFFPLVKCMLSRMKNISNIDLVGRPSISNYQPSLWSYEYIQSLKNGYEADLYEDRAKKLEEEVRRMINNKDTKLLTTPERPERHVTMVEGNGPWKQIELRQRQINGMLLLDGWNGLRASI